MEASVAVVASDPMPIDSSNAPAAVPAAADAKPSDAVEAPIVEKKEEEKKPSLDEQKLYQQVKVVLMNAEVREEEEALFVVVYILTVLV